MPIADMDFETYSEAGYEFKHDIGRWKSISKTPPHGIGAVGAHVYAEHPSTEVISLAYDLKDGGGPRLWLPGMKPPLDLFKHINHGGLIEAANSMFEYSIWHYVCHSRMGWPVLLLNQLRDVLAKGRGYALPGSLDKASKAIGASALKDTDGKRLIKIFSMPRNPTKTNPSLRTLPTDRIDDAMKFYTYNINDIVAEAALSELIPDLHPTELRVWLLDQKINMRGVYVDAKAVDAGIEILEAATRKYTAELIRLTDGYVNTASEVKKMTEWLEMKGIRVDSLDSDGVEALLERDYYNPEIKPVLEIRKRLAASSAKKVYAIKRRICLDGRVRGMFVYCGGERTGRFAGRGPQPQNLKSKGPLPEWNIAAVDTAIGIMQGGDLGLVEGIYGDAIATVAGCLRGMFTAAPGHELVCSDFSQIEAVVLAYLAGEGWRMEAFRLGKCIYEISASKITGVALSEFDRYRSEHDGDSHPFRKTIGKVAELACFGANTLVRCRSGWKRIVDIHISDEIYDGDEYVKHGGVVNHGYRDTIILDGVRVTPDHRFNLAADRWVDAKDLYIDNALYRLTIDTTADRVYGSIEDVEIPLFNTKPGVTGGKVFDILNCGPRNRYLIKTDSGVLVAHNSGYGGGIGAWKAFGAEKHFDSDNDIKLSVKKWRKDSPAIVDFWYKTERAAISATTFPGTRHTVRGITWQRLNDVLYCTLLSGRRLVYHKPEVHETTPPWGGVKPVLSYMGYNSDPTKGAMGWIRIKTWHGKLTENIVQAVARDILVNSMLNLETAGYPIVMHVHDEIISEIEENEGDLAEFETIMAMMPTWCREWPIRAAGGWRGKRYRKD